MKAMESENRKMFSGAQNSSVGGEGNPDAAEWEIRPGGMLVQKRDSNTDQRSAPIPIIKLRVKYGSSNHEIRISSQASFGELKKILAEQTGLHHEDQKLIYKKKERDSKDFLDSVRVKHGSKIVLVEDIAGRERRCLEMLKNSKTQKISKSLAEISLEVDKFGGQVKDLEATASRGGKMSVNDVEKLTEVLMSQLIKLDGIVAEGDLKLQRRMQVKRVQKYIETLDTLKLSSPKPSSNGGKTPLQQQQQQHNQSISQSRVSIQRHQEQLKQRNVSEHSESVVVTTKWETFD